MLEIANVIVPVSSIPEASQEARVVQEAVRRRLHLAPDAMAGIEIRRRSIDARKGHSVKFVYTVRFALRAAESGEQALLRKLSRQRKAPQVQVALDSPEELPSYEGAVPDDRPLVVGAGCAGLFCAWTLARQGLAPILIEQGDDVVRRREAIDCFNETGQLDTRSNIQFGLGGAGTFSDGKLTTRTHGAHHGLIMETLVEAGASPEILVDAMPHIGSDVLPQVVSTLIKQIEAWGGQIRYRCKLEELVLEGSGDHRRIAGARVMQSQAPKAQGVELLPRPEEIKASRVIMACGHSARDVFEMAQALQVPLEPKTFSMGVRIEHLQREVDLCQYGEEAQSPLLGPASYKLVAKTSTGRRAYSFCMCPGGYVVAAASEAFGVVTNGMSLAARDGANANAGLLVNVYPKDLDPQDPLAGVALQRRCEQAAYEAGGGAFKAPAQLVGDFLEKRPSSGPGTVEPTYPRGVTWGSIDGLLPGYIADTLREALPIMGRKLRCFNNPEAVLTGVESRSSSPIRLCRGQDFQSLGIRGLYPIGEGAGYAGGIMSAAVDGVNCAVAILKED